MDRETASLAAPESVATTVSGVPAVLLGRFQLVRRLGAGGMGDVFEARDLSLGASVALKTIRPDLVGDFGALDRLRREVVLARRVTHPNVCRIFDFFEAGTGEGTTRAFFTMELLNGETIGQHLRNNAPFGLDEVLPLLADVVAALEAIHATGIVHRDLKPGNVMLVRREGRVRAVVTDFGIALGGTEERLTSSGMLVGTPDAMAPEQRERLTVTPRTDVYALALLAYQMVTGQLPDPEVEQRLPLRWRTSLRRSLAAEPKDRHETPRALLESLARPRVPRMVRGLVLLLGALVLATGGWLGWQGHRRSTTPPSVAVLPLVNLSADPADAYFCDGLTEDLVTQLAHLPGLKVVSRASTAGSRDDAKLVREIAKTLGVTNVLTGSVRRAGGRVRIAAQLIDVSTDAHVWAETYDRDAREVLDLQTEVAREVAAALKLRLTGLADSQLGRGTTRNPEAYDDYLRGLSLEDRWPEGARFNDEAIDAFEQALAKDPTYALAHAQLAYAYARKALFRSEGAAVGRAWFERSKVALTRAEQLEPRLALVHVVRAELLFSQYSGWDMEGALQEVRATRALDPNTSHFEASVIYSHLGLATPTIREAQAALDQDPSSHECQWNLINAYALMGRYAEALRAWERMGRPEHALSFAWMGMISEGRRDELRKLLDPDDFLPKALLHAAEGDAAEAEHNLSELFARGEPSIDNRLYHHDAFSIAAAYAALGRPDEAVRWLRNSASNGFPNYVAFSRDPLLTKLHGYPGYESLLAELKPRWERWTVENP